MNAFPDLPDNASKDEELAYYDRFVRTLPPHTYLRLYFGDDTVRNEFAWCIRNDFGPPDIPGVRAEIMRMREEVKKVQAELAKVQQRIGEAKETEHTIRYRIEQARRKLSEAIGSTSLLEGMVRTLNAA